MTNKSPIAAMDAVFRGVAEPTRRSLLDELFRADGQTLRSLEGRFSMTRFGLMKHLKHSRKRAWWRRSGGDEKLHFLNPVPIRLVHDRWVSKYAEPWAAGLSGLKSELERTMGKVFEIYIRTTPERLWEAITDPDIRSKYNCGSRVASDWTPGSRFEMSHPEASVVLGEGENVEIDPPRRLVQTVTHDQLREGANEELYAGWPMVLSGLKTWLETGELLTTPSSLMYT